MTMLNTIANDQGLNSDKHFLLVLCETIQAEQLHFIFFAFAIAYQGGHLILHFCFMERNLGDDDVAYPYMYG